MTKGRTDSPTSRFRLPAALRALVLALSVHAAGIGTAWSQVDVYMGFMDEEVNDQVTALVKKYPNRRVIVIERGSKAGSDGRLFERPMDSYGVGADKPTVLHTKDLASSGAAASDSLETQIAKGIKGRVESDAFQKSIAGSAIPEGAAPKTALKGGGIDTSMTVVGFNPKAPPDDPIILIRSPEMGLQPDLVKPYLEPALDTIHGLPQAAKAKGGVQASVFGTGGAISEKLPGGKLALPGTRTPVKASVYVGVEMVPGSNPPRYKGVIAVADSKNPPSYFFNKEFSSREAAQEAAKAAFKSPGMGMTAATEGPYKGKTFKGALQAIDPSPERKVSLTISFFGGEDVKKAGATFGLNNVNMEDYHVFNATRGKVDAIGVTRLNCDPHEISPDMVKRVTSWAKETKYTAGTYADAMLWGLKGSPRGDPLQLRSGNWAAGEKSPFKGLSVEKMREMALTTLGPGGVPVVLDPFYAEIASDFLKDAAKGDIFSNKFKNAQNVEVTTHTRVISEKIMASLSEQAKEELEALMKAKSDLLKSLAQTIMGDFKAGVPDETIRTKIVAMMEEANSLDFRSAPKLAGEIREIAQREIKAANAVGKAVEPKWVFARDGQIRLLGAENSVGKGEKTTMEIWVREGKWSDNTSRTLDYMLAEKDVRAKAGSITHETLSQAFEHGKLDGAAVDRALYKSTITPGTQEFGPMHVADEEAAMANGGQETRVGAYVTLMIDAGFDAGVAARVGTHLRGLCGNAGGAL